MPNHIPIAAREAVKRRAQGRCERCGGGRGHEIHHRRSRRVRDEHCHCLCNLVNLCGTCHRWAHGQPYLSQLEGFIVLTQRVPNDTPLTHHSLGEVYPTCFGAWKEKRDVPDR